MPQPPRTPRTPRRKHSVAEMRANPAWRKYLTDAQLTPAQRKTRTRNTALKADPLAPVTSMKDLTGQAGVLVDTQQADEKAAIAEAQKRSDAEFATRRGMYSGMADYQTRGAQDAFRRTTDAINAVITASNAGSTADQTNLAGVLRASDEAARASAAQLGVQPAAAGSTPASVPQDSTTERLAALAGTQEGVRQQIGQSGAAAIAAEGSMQQIPGQQLSINLANLTGERNKSNEELGDKRTTLAKNRKGLIRQAIRDLQDFEVAKRQYGDQHANMLFQQFMAEKEFSAKEKQQSFAEWLQTAQLTGVTPPGGPVPAGQTTIGGRAQDTADRTAGAAITGRDPVTGAETVDAKNARLTRDIDWFNARTNRATATAAIQANLDAARTAKTKEKRDAAEQKAARLAKGITAMDAFLAPKPGEGAPPAATSRYPVGTSIETTDPKTGQPQMIDNPKAGKYDPATGKTAPDKIPASGRPYVRRFNDALAYLKSQGMSHSDALRTLSMSTYTDWSSKAKGMLSRMKRRQRGQNAPEPKPKPRSSRSQGAANVPLVGGLVK